MRKNSRYWTPVSSGLLPQKQKNVQITYIGCNDGIPHCDGFAYLEDGKWYWSLDGSSVDVKVTAWAYSCDPYGRTSDLIDGAVDMMRLLKVSDVCIDELTNNNKIYVSDFTGMHPVSHKELMKKISDIESEYDIFVYHVIHSITRFGELYSFLYINNCYSDFNKEFNHEMLDHSIVKAYVWNRSDEICSEFGLVKVAEKNGALIRLC